MFYNVKAFIRKYIYELHTYPTLSAVVHLKFRKIPLRFLLGLYPISRYLSSHENQERYFEVFVNERVVEVPFVWRQLDLPLRSRILDFGCVDSLLPIQLASVGYEVSGIDLRPYSYTHPNFSFQQRNLVDAFAQDTFDGVMSVSVVEHIGLGRYGDESMPGDSDTKVMDEICRILKPGGMLILSVPFGRKFDGNRYYRVYDQAGIDRLLSNFSIENQEFYRRYDGSYWVSCSGDDIADLASGDEPDNPSRTVNGVFCVKARKR